MPTNCLPNQFNLIRAGTGQSMMQMCIETKPLCHAVHYPCAAQMRD
jgi:hypothetical protein